MAVTAKWYGQALGLVLTKKVDLLADAINVALVKSTYTPNQDGHVYWSDVVPASNEASGTGYTAGGLALASKTLAYDAPSNQTLFGAANPAWTALTVTARYAIYYDRTPATDATRPVLCYVDFGADVSVIAGVLSLDLTAGIVSVTPS